MLIIIRDGAAMYAGECPTDFDVIPESSDDAKRYSEFAQWLGEKPVKGALALEAIQRIRHLISLSDVVVMGDRSPKTLERVKTARIKNKNIFENMGKKYLELSEAGKVKEHLWPI